MFLYITEQAEIWENEQTDILKQKSILEGGDKVAHDEEERSWIFLLWTTVTLSENAKLVASVIMTLGFLGGSVVKNPPDKQEMQVQSLVGRSTGEGSRNPLQDSCLGNPMDRGIYSPWGCKEPVTTQ